MDGYIRKSGRKAHYMSTSKNGNPRFLVEFDDGTSFRTQPDAGCAYGIENSELDGPVWVKVVRGEIVDIRPAGEVDA